MAIRELAIIAKARETLNDLATSNPRWSDKRLLEHLSDAQEDMCKQHPLIARKVDVVTTVGQETYFLPTDTTRVLSATSGGKAIPFISADELDALDATWEEKVGSAYEYIVVNQLSQAEIRPYPLMNETQTNYDNLRIKFRYSSFPLPLGWDDTAGDCVEELVISTMWDFALRQYVIGMAFADYGDASNLTRSQTAMQFYGREMQLAEKLSKKGFAKRKLTTPYQGSVTRKGKR